MTTDTDGDLRSTFAAAHEPARRSGSILLVLLVAGAIIAAAVAFMKLGRSQARCSRLPPGSSGSPTASPKTRLRVRSPIMRSMGWR